VKARIVSAIDRIDMGSPIDIQSIRKQLSEARDNIQHLQHEGLPPAKSKPGRMSGDRVRIVLPERRMKRDAFMRAAQEAFSLSAGELAALPKCQDHYLNGGVEVICRPSQFGRFMILRNEYGDDNSVKDLQPELFRPTPVKQPLDVSRRKNEYNAKQKDA
jgi:hypothetical protein